MKETNKSFWKDGLSIDETKFSILVLSYMIALTAFLILCVVNNDIENVKDVVVLLLGSIFGINISRIITKNPIQAETIEEEVQPEPIVDDGAKG